MRRVRCPRCNAVIQAVGNEVKCTHCGLAGRVDGPSTKPERPPTKGDPWTITLDLRKLAPRNWSSGTKAFSMLLLLGLVFAAGGMTGAAFERARVDIASDLNEGSDLLSRNAQAPSNETPGDLDPAPNASQEPPGPDPEPGNTSPPADPEPERFEPVSISGQGGDIVGPLDLPAGLIQLKISYHGDTKFFTAKLHLQVERPELRVDASDSGSFVGMVRYGGLSQSGQYYVHTNAAEGETWEIDIETPDRDASGSVFSVTGNGDEGIGPFRFSGGHNVTFDNPSPWSYELRVYDQDGKRLGCSFAGGAGATTTTCTVTSQTLVYFDIRIKGSEDDWRLSAESA